MCPFFIHANRERVKNKYAVYVYSMCKIYI